MTNFVTGDTPNAPWPASQMGPWPPKKENRMAEDKFGIRHVAAALHDFLASRDIPGREQVALVIVAQDPRTASYISAEIKKDFDAIDMIYSSRSLNSRADIVLEGVPICVRSPKPTVEL